MTYKERELEICRNCLNRSECPYYVRDMSYKCQTNQQIMSGWKLGQQDTLEEIEKAWNSSDIGCITETAVINKIKELKKG